MTLLDDIHDERFKNEDDLPQFENYPDISSQEYNNFVEIPEYHNYYEEFPTVYWENAYDRPEEEERKRERDSSSDSSSSGASASSSAVAMGSATGRLGIGGRVSGRGGGRGGRSSGGGSSAGSSSAFAGASAASILAATFIALVAVAGFVLPAIDNADLSIDMDVDYGGDTLAYMVSLTNASANAKYYVVVMEGQTVVYEKEIIDGYQAGVVEGLDGTKDHRVEVRTGLIPLHVVDSATIPGQSEPFIPAEINSLTATMNTIDYDITVKGSTTTVTMGIYPAEGEAAVFTKVLAEGANTGSVLDLMYNHEYVVKLFDEEKTYIIKAVTTERNIQDPSALPVDFTYGESKSIVVTGLEETPTMSYAVQSGSSVTVDESTGALTWTSVGETVIRASFAETEHYKAGYIDVTVTTQKATQTPSASPVDFTYGESKSIVVTGLEETPTMSYAVQSGSSVTVDESTGALTWVGVGQTTITISYEGTPHYELGSIDTVVTSAKAQQSPTGNEFEFVYNGENTLTVGGLEEGPDVEYAVSDGSDTVITVTPAGVLTWVSAGTKIVTATISETLHYEATTFDITVTAIRADSDITVTGIGGLSYTSPEKALVTKAGNNEQTVQYSIDGGTNWSPDIPVFTNAGTYTVLFKADETDHYKALENDSVDVPVAKATAYIAVTGGQAFDYDGQAPSIETTGKVGGGDVSFTHYTESTGGAVISPAPVNAGTYWVTATVAEDENYNEFTTERVAYTINKIASDLTFEAAGDLTYEDIGTGELILKTAGNDEQVIEYSTDGTNWSEVVPKAAATGEFTVYFRAQSSTNYEALAQDSVSGIVRAQQTPSASPVELAYGESKSIVVTGLGDTPEMSYVVRSGSSATVNESTGALTWASVGETVIRASFAETTHYVAGYIDVTVNVVKAEQNPSADPVIVPYEGVGVITVTGLEETPAMSYAVQPGSSVTVDDSGNLEWVSIGDSTVRVSFAETTHYLEGYIDVSVTAKSALNMNKTVVGDKAIAVANLEEGYSKNTTICLYSDAECTTAVVSPEAVTGSSAVYDFTIPGSGTYYIGVWGGGSEDLLAAESVSKSSDPFSVGGEYLAYNVDLGEIEGTVSIKQDSTVVFTDSESPFHGNFSDWGYSHDYTLVVTVSGTEISIKTLTLSSAITGLTASVSRQDVDYTVTSVTYPLTIYICDSSSKVVGSRSLAVGNTGGTITSTVYYGTTYNAYVYKSGLGTGDTIDPSKCPTPVSVNTSAAFAIITPGSISAGQADINLTFNYEWGRSDWDSCINIQVYDSGALADSENTKLWGFSSKPDQYHEVYNLYDNSVEVSVGCELDNWNTEAQKVYTLRIYSMTYGSAGSVLLVESDTITIPPSPPDP